MTNWVTPEAEGLAIAAIFMAIGAFALWRMRRPKARAALAAVEGPFRVPADDAIRGTPTATCA